MGWSTAKPTSVELESLYNDSRSTDWAVATGKSVLNNFAFLRPLMVNCEITVFVSVDTRLAHLPAPGDRVPGAN